MSHAAVAHGSTGAYDAAHTGAIVVARTDRVQLRAHGRDPVRMIQGLLTNDLDRASAERAVYGAMLTPKGRMVADMRVVRNQDGSVLLDLDRTALDALTAHVRKYVPPMFARFEPHEPELAVIGVYGPQSTAVVRAALAIDIADDAPEYAVARAGDALAIASREAGVPGADVFVPAERADAVRDSLLAAGATEGDLGTTELLRVEAGRPRWGAELDENRIPLEANLLERAISTSKGCYTGQEVIVRILHRGHVNWQLRGLLLGDRVPPVPGVELTAADGVKPIARVTSALRSPALGQTIALGYVRREISPGSELRLPDGGRAIVVELPFATE